MDEKVVTDEWVDFEFAKVRRHYFRIGFPQRCAIEHFLGPHTINGKGHLSSRINIQIKRKTRKY